MTDLNEYAKPNVEVKTETTPSKKKPYQAPAWVMEEVFEKIALACAKAASPDCDPGPIQS